MLKNISKFNPSFISFIIPTVYNVTMLETCIKSIHNLDKNVDYEIIVVEDGAPDHIHKQLVEMSNSLGFSLYSNPVNLGYTKSINIGIKHAKGDVIVLVNDDIIFEQKEWLLLTIKVFSLHPKIGIVGCRLLYPDRKIQHGGMKYIGGLQLIGHKYWGLTEDTPEAVKTVRTIAVTGAVLAVNKDVISDIGLLNEDFIMLCSDTDYCLTANKKGWFVVYNGRSYAIHHESKTRKKLSNLSVEKTDLIRFYKKWKGTLDYLHLQKMI